MKRIFQVILLLVVIGCAGSKKTPTDRVTQKSLPIFQLMNSDSTGVEFANNLTHDVSTKANLFDFDYFYNGAGVGVADINNDGLEDIFFCGNQVANKLYLNMGGLKFKDISDSANVNVGKQWTNGVTYADVNGDGWLDIYVSQGGPKERLERRNLLYINNQDLTFTESSAIYGLDDDGISTQSAFFDYDKDGDLDCIVMNESELYGMDPIKFHQVLLTNRELLHRNSCHFYENREGTFVDVTEKAGLLRPAFGLGLVVSDINEDGWLDLYMANDYYIPDFMFINQKNGRFNDEIKARTTQLSFFGMGADIGDVNNDGKQDIFVLDMASQDHVRSKTLMASMNTDNFDLLTKSLEFQHQYMFNSLQLNLGNNRYRNIAHFTGAAKTDWSWSVLMNDFNNDGNKDLFITNGYRRYALDNDFKNQVLKTQKDYQNEVPLEVKASLYDSMPSEKLSNLLYINEGDFRFEESASKHKVSQPSFSNGAAVADLDGDGDLELVVNNIDQKAFVYKNLTTEQQESHFLKIKTEGILSESFPKVFVFHNGKVQMAESKKVRGYFSSVSPTSHFGLGSTTLVDSVLVYWPSGLIQKRTNISSDQTITFKEEVYTHEKKSGEIGNSFIEQVSAGKLKLFYKHVENLYNDFQKEILLPYKQSSMGPFISRSGEGEDEYIFVGGARGQAGRLWQWKEDRFEKVEGNDFEVDTEYEDMEAEFLDLDGDGDQDMYIVSGGNSLEEGNEYYEDRVYINQENVFKRSYAALPDAPRLSGKSITKLDIDGDGDEDLILGNRIIPQAYPLAGNNQILENRGGILIDVTQEKAPSFRDFGIVNSVIATDFDSDGLTDIIAVGEWTSVGMFKNKGEVYEDVSSEYGMDKLSGLWFDVKEVEINGDGRPDYILGNIGLNTKFKTSNEKPFKLFAHDFDTNGTLDIVLSSTYKDEYVPVRGRECSSQQMPFISEKYETYEDFANATVYDIFAEQMDSSLEYESSTFASFALVSSETQGFVKVQLPAEAQFFPIQDCEVVDVNGDGKKEMIVMGNIYDTEVETPRWDGGTGVLLEYDGEFKAKTLDMQGNIKDIEVIETNEGDVYIVAAKNNDLMSVYRLRNDY